MGGISGREAGGGSTLAEAFRERSYIYRTHVDRVETEYVVGDQRNFAVPCQLCPSFDSVAKKSN